jgi:hypothetical protein
MQNLLATGGQLHTKWYLSGRPVACKLHPRGASHMQHELNRRNLPATGGHTDTICLRLAANYLDVMGCTAVLWIRIRTDPELFAGSGSGSGLNSFGSGSDQYLTFPVKKSYFLNQMHKKSEYLAHIQYI